MSRKRSREEQSPSCGGEIILPIKTVEERLSLVCRNPEELKKFEMRRFGLDTLSKHMDLVMSFTLESGGNDGEVDIRFLLDMERVDAYLSRKSSMVQRQLLTAFRKAVSAFDHEDAARCMHELQQRSNFVSEQERCVSRNVISPKILSELSIEAASAFTTDDHVMAWIDIVRARSIVSINQRILCTQGLLALVLNRCYGMSKDDVCKVRFGPIGRSTRGHCIDIEHSELQVTLNPMGAMVHPRVPAAVIELVRTILVLSDTRAVDAARSRYDHRSCDLSSVIKRRLVSLHGTMVFSQVSVKRGLPVVYSGVPPTRVGVVTQAAGLIEPHFEQWLQTLRGRVTQTIVDEMAAQVDSDLACTEAIEDGGVVTNSDTVDEAGTGPLQETDVDTAETVTGAETEHACTMASDDTWIDDWKPISNDYPVSPVQSQPDVVDPDKRPHCVPQELLQFPFHDDEPGWFHRKRTLREFMRTYDVL